MITTEQIKELRDKTGVSVMQCKKALEEARGDMDKAIIVLRKKGSDIASKKSDRTLGSGRIASYIHGNGTVGTLVELSSETDFVSKNDEFYALAHDIAMQIAATNPTYLKREDVTEEEKNKAMEVFEKEVVGKPEAIKEKILQGKLDSYLADKILLEQIFVKDGNLKIKDLIESAIQKFGEKIEIARFARFSVLEK
ncbi:MAG: elongation factor Ts [Patescibacteria group bacterium]|nr:elongation factor Ts [Patescibacteria group bacterium]MDE1988090.1 elongation factor Ts [Patescibacteria group bacterium]MDE2218195.1 elongation factor Ts [Patescibacteria group bacterium]